MQFTLWLIQLTSIVYWLVDWLTDWQTDMLMDWLTHWLTCWLTDWLFDGLTETVVGILAHSFSRWRTDRLTLICQGADSLTQWMTYQVTLLSGGWEANSLVRWFSNHRLTVLGLTDQLITSQKQWLIDSTVWWLTNGHWLNESEQTCWLSKDLLSNSLTHWMTYWLSLLSRNWQADLLTEWFRADLLTFLGLVTSTVWGLTNWLTDWMIWSRLAGFPRTCHLYCLAADKLTYWLNDLLIT